MSYNINLKPRPINLHLVNNNLITFSTCWYILKSKFPIEQYLKWINNLLSIVHNFNLVIYTDENSYKTIQHLINPNNNKIKVIIKPIEDFYTYKYKEYWIKNHEKSNMELHKMIDWKLNMLWNEKVFFVNETIQRSYFKSLHYGWCDIGYFRNAEQVKNHQFRRWPSPVTLLNDIFINHLIHYGCVQDSTEKYTNLSSDIITHYNLKLNAPPTNKYEEVCFAGGFFILKPYIIKHYLKLYNEKLVYYFTNNYFIKDDQSIIQDIIFTNPSLFYIHRERNKMVDNWFMFQRLLL
jgi:hypothetical protein